MYVKERVLWIKHLFRRIRSIQVKRDFEDMNIQCRTKIGPVRSSSKSKQKRTRRNYSM